MANFITQHQTPNTQHKTGYPTFAYRFDCDPELFLFRVFPWGKPYRFRKPIRFANLSIIGIWNDFDKQYK